MRTHTGRRWPITIKEGAPRTSRVVIIIMPHTALNLSDEGTVTTEFLFRNLVVRESLGEGGFGRAYKARLNGRHLVVKLPITLVRPDDQIPNLRRRAGARLDDVLLPPGQVSDAVWREAVVDFKEECRNAEKVLDPPDERRIRKHYQGQRAGRSLLWSTLTPEEQDLVVAERDRWKNEPGYAHMHPVLHLDRHIPLLLSEYAPHTLRGLSFVLGESQDGVDQWLVAARQLADAVTFLRRSVKMAHLDIKPNNVFYKMSAGRPHIWLGDYGLMARKNKQCTFRTGTRLYMPPARLQAELSRDHFTNDHQQLFGYYVTLVNLLTYRNANGGIEQLSRGHCPSVSDALLAAIAQRNHPLFTNAPPELFQHFMVPLFDASLYILDVLFERTRAWLQTLP
jgi:serine/threonine protein kinase